MVKNLPANAGDAGDTDWGDPWEEEMATHSGILAWRIAWTEEPGRLQSRGLRSVGHDCALTHAHSTDTAALRTGQLRKGTPEQGPD